MSKLSFKKKSKLLKTIKIVKMSVDAPAKKVSVPDNINSQCCANNWRHNFKETWEQTFIHMPIDLSQIYSLFDWKHKENLGAGIFCEVRKSPGGPSVNCHFKWNIIWSIYTNSDKLNEAYFC